MELACNITACFCCARYHLRDVIIGSVHFLRASDDIDKVSVQIVRRETTNKPGLQAQQYYAAVLVGRITALARPSVRPSVRPSA